MMFIMCFRLSTENKLLPSVAVFKRGIHSFNFCSASLHLTKTVFGMSKEIEKTVIITKRETSANTENSNPTTGEFDLRLLE